MAFDRGKPDNSGVIRNAPTEIRANWDAIEENEDTAKANALNQWAVHLIDRNDSTVSGSATPTDIETVGMLYCNGTAGVNNLYFQDGSASASRVQLTRTDKVVDAEDGMTFLPGGLLLQWFKKTSVAGGASSTITLPTAMTTIYNVQAQPSAVGDLTTTNIAINDITTGAGVSFTVYNKSSARDFYFLVIGK